MTTSTVGDAGRLLAGLVDRPVGEDQLASVLTWAPFSAATWIGAENLLIKAVRALRAGDEHRATGLVERAAALPFDDNAETAPAACAVHLMLYSLVTDVLEMVEEGDQRWVDAAIKVLGAADEHARPELRDVLQAIDQDYSLTPREHRRLRSAISEVEPLPALVDRSDLTPAELAVRVTSILRVCIRFDDAAADALA